MIFVPILERLEYSFLFGSGKIILYRDSLLISMEYFVGIFIK